MRRDIEILSTDRVLNTENFYGKSCRKCAPKESPLLNFAKKPKTAIACTKLFLKDILKENILKSLKKGNFIFSFKLSFFKWTEL